MFAGNYAPFRLAGKCGRPWTGKALVESAAALSYSEGTCHSSEEQPRSSMAPQYGTCLGSA